jgi:1-acyl-sn-glycerol-3-phosphate acyltransferase
MTRIVQGYRGGWVVAPWLQSGHREEGLLEPWYHVAKAVGLPPLKLWFNWRLEGVDRVPPEGPIIIAGNHLSYLDPLAHAYFVVQAGRRPRFLAKAELFENPFLRVVLRGAGQIPVRRGTGDQTPLEEAARALNRGEVVVIYPEGTSMTENHDLSPVRGKTGAVRLSIRTGVPILPVATWGGQYVWRKGGGKSFAFGRPIWLKAGDPVDPPAMVQASEQDPELVRRLTEELMGRLAVLVDDLRSRYPKRWA